MRKWILPVAMLACVGTAHAQTQAHAKAPVTAQDSARWVKGLLREAFSYGGSGRRDPFMSLMSSSDIRPLPSDLRLVAVVFDPDGRSSVAVLRDLTAKTQYSVKMNQPIGRMRVSAIQPRSVTFTLEEYGFSRKETLVLGDSSKVRTQ